MTEYIIDTLVFLFFHTKVFFSLIIFSDFLLIYNSLYWLKKINFVRFKTSCLFFYLSMLTMIKINHGVLMGNRNRSKHAILSFRDTTNVTDKIEENFFLIRTIKVYLNISVMKLMRCDPAEFYK